MADDTPLGDKISFPVAHFKNSGLIRTETLVAAEVPLTFVVNGSEIATMVCTPTHLEEYIFGFLFTSGFIQAAGDIVDVDLDTRKWRAQIELKEAVDPELLGRRVYTSGCGKGVMYTSVTELAGRHPLDSDLCIDGESILRVMKWLSGCSDLHRQTGGVHSAAASIRGALPQFHIDDIGRHNAVDKVLGRLLMDGTDTRHVLLAATGRVSSEILHKARRLNIPILASRGAPTHQSILLAADMGVTLVGFARRSSFTVFTHPRRIRTNEA